MGGADVDPGTTGALQCKIDVPFSVLCQSSPTVLMEGLAVVAVVVVVAVTDVGDVVGGVEDVVGGVVVDAVVADVVDVVGVVGAVVDTVDAAVVVEGRVGHMAGVVVGAVVAVVWLVASGNNEEVGRSIGVLYN